MDHSLSSPNSQHYHGRRDNWTSMPRRSLCRTHSSLLISGQLLHRQQSLLSAPKETSESPNAKSPRSPNAIHSVGLRRLESVSSDGGNVMVEDIHLTPDWYHLTLQKIESAQNKAASPIEDTAKATMAQNEIEETCKMVRKAIKLRKKWLYKGNEHIGSRIRDKNITLNVDKHKHSLKAKSIDDQYSFQFTDGIARIYQKQIDDEEKQNDDDNEQNEIFKTYSFDEYIEDLNFLFSMMSFGPAKTLCYKRLKILQSRFKLHLLFNSEVEATETSSVPYRDFYNVRKIDNHIHHSAAMHQKHLLRFMKDKYKSHKNKIVTKDGKTMKQIFNEINVKVEHLSVDKLDVHAQQATFQRFDKFNAKYNPLGQRPLRNLFLKIDNEIKGEFLAEMTKEVFADLEYQRYQFCEYRLSIYGKKRSEWDIVGDWICNNRLHSPQVRWMIQVPRIYPAFKNSSLIKNFNEMLANIFVPLFEVTIDPSTHPSLYLFLNLVVGFDSVDDESKPESMENTKYPTPQQWDGQNNPPYIYYMYFMWVNLYKLNKLREANGLNTFALRPHSGEAGSLNHLASTFLVSQSINHGIRLRYSPVLQYLYYLEQIGISVSPLSNNILFEEYEKNPFPAFFERGLNVTLSTDDPLLIHYTKDALLEEYSIAAQVYNFSTIDLCEIARNSVIQCGWDHTTKKEWIGEHYDDRKGADANDIYKTNVPNSRIQFRYLLLNEEKMFIKTNGKEVLSESQMFLDTNLRSSSMTNLKNIPRSIDVRNVNDNTNMKYKKIKNEENQLSPIDDADFYNKIQLGLHANKDVLDGLIEEEENENEQDDEFDIDDGGGLTLNKISTLHQQSSAESFGSATSPLRANEVPFLTGKSRKSYDTDLHRRKRKLKSYQTPKDDDDDDCKLATTLNDKIDRLMKYIDSFTAGDRDIDTKAKKNIFNAIFIETEFGTGKVIAENDGYYEVELDSMIASIKKTDCTTHHTHGTNVQTPLGCGVIIDSNDRYYTVEFDDKMISSIAKSECTAISYDNNANPEVAELRDIRNYEMNQVYELEIDSYPSDEAASLERLYYRYIYARQYFKVFTLNDIIIGFICGTKTAEAKLTDETMSIHDKNGKHLCIHSVVIDKKYRKKGYGTEMMKLYLKQEIGSFTNNSLKSIRLVCKKNLINFYKNCGFKLIGKSDLVHGKDPWYEMSVQIIHE